MNFWERITGSDLTRDWQAFEARAAALPEDYRQAWGQIEAHLWEHADFTGRNLTPIVDGVLGLLETTAAEGQGVASGKSAMELIGPDVAAFCDDLIGDEQTYADLYQESIRKKS
ncbi:MAG: DUF1048 domain-containing protein [Bifidobacteriaceae bacterium]|jgi:DNA-binding ferritin-like protein (Dps family)|nr:DUF1048 domain-containing protein [Bifidobacteriaceae bacterium]